MPAGTGFVIAPNVVATACHVLDYFRDAASDPDKVIDSLWVKIDFGEKKIADHEFLITGIVGRGSLKGQDYALLSVASQSEDAQASLPAPLQPSSQPQVGKFLGVVGYPDMESAASACQRHDSTCDETAQWFSNYVQKNPGVAKIISPGSKTGQFSRGAFQIFTYDAPTLGGQSGSPVVDLETGMVVGIHYCCTGYAARTESLSCAQITPISLGDKSSNEAISIKDVNLNPNVSPAVVASLR